jgi:hypothetical protein
MSVLGSTAMKATARKCAASRPAQVAGAITCYLLTAMRPAHRICMIAAPIGMPTIPDRAIATMPDMVAARGDVQAYLAAGDASISSPRTTHRDCAAR